MQEEKNGQTPRDEPPPATPDILKKAEDTEEEPPPATQESMHFAEDPPEAKQDIMLKMLTQADLDKISKCDKEEDEEG